MNKEALEKLLDAVKNFTDDLDEDEDSVVVAKVQRQADDPEAEAETEETEDAEDLIIMDEMTDLLDDMKEVLINAYTLGIIKGWRARERKDD